jgi:membrane AbrB-like protein
VALTLALGLAGALLFSWLGMPLPWVLGPMTFGLVASLWGAPMELPDQVRPPAIMVIGVLLGTRFSPETISQIVEWYPTVIAVIVYVMLCGMLCVVYLRRVAKLDLPTAYFSGMPGGLAEMSILAAERGGDVKTVAMAHSTRVVVIVFLLPVIVQFATGEQLGRRVLGGTSILETPASSWVWLIATALVGALVGHVLRLPSPFLLGPVLISTVVHLLGWSNFAPATELVAVAQLIIGTQLGCRFSGIGHGEVFRVVGLSLGSIAILMLGSLVFALALVPVVGKDFVSLFLAFSAGGLTESTLIALSLHADVAFIAAHHIVRILTVTFGAGLVFRLVEKWRGKS